MATKQLRDLELEFVGINPGHRHDSDKDLGTMNSPEQLINKPILSKEERDQLELMRLGKTPILKVCQTDFRGQHDLLMRVQR